MRRIEKRGAVNVLCDDDGNGRMPATRAEIEFFDEIERLRAEVEALKAENERQFTALNDWLYANGPNGWIDLLRHELAAMTTEVEALRADALKQVDCRQCKHATNRGCHSTALCERGELFEATPPWQFYDAARAAQGGET